MAEWWRTFFDDDYFHLWGGATPPERTEAEADAIVALLRLARGARVLDAPCGYGRLSRALAARGMQVHGADQSRALLDRAASARGGAQDENPTYVEHDLRRPLAGGGFDAAINMFSSLGYGSEEDDLAILHTLATAVRPGGVVFVDTAHRDRVAISRAGGGNPAQRLTDGTLIVEEARFDPVAGRVDTTWYWSGPSGSGQKSASLRIYAATELIALIEAVGLSVRSVHDGASARPFDLQSSRLGVVAERPAVLR